MSRKSIVIGTVLLVVGLIIGVAAGYGLAPRGNQASENRASGKPAGPDAAHAAKKEQRVLYWYDPMVPDQHFDKPGKSPFMDMELQPKYAEDDSGRPGLAVSPALEQNLGLRYATAVQRAIVPVFDAPGTTQLDASDVVVVQARTGGFVRRVAVRTPGEPVRAGSALLDMVAPEWAAAQQEFLALQRSDDAALVAAARQRLIFLGMPETLVKNLEQDGAVQPAIIRVPIDGVLQALSVRDGMAVSPGMTLATITGTSQVWVEVAVPEVRARQVRAGQAVDVTLPSHPGTVLAGVVKSVLAEGNADTRTLRVRIVLPNRDGRLQAGLSVVARFTGKTQQAVVVPAEAVIRTGTRAIVYVAGSDGKLRPVIVHPGIESGDVVAIDGGIEDGQRVVVSGQFLIDSESSLRGLVPVETGGPSP